MHAKEKDDEHQRALAIATSPPLVDRYTCGCSRRQSEREGPPSAPYNTHPVSNMSIASMTTFGRDSITTCAVCVKPWRATHTLARGANPAPTQAYGRLLGSVSRAAQPPRVCWVSAAGLFDSTPVHGRGGRRSPAMMKTSTGACAPPRVFAAGGWCAQRRMRRPQERIATHRGAPLCTARWAPTASRRGEAQHCRRRRSGSPARPHGVSTVSTPCPRRKRGTCRRKLVRTCAARVARTVTSTYRPSFVLLSATLRSSAVSSYTDATNSPLSALPRHTRWL